MKVWEEFFIWGYGGITVSAYHRKTDRKKLVLGSERAKAHYELLAPDYRRKLQIMYIHYPVGRNEGEFISHEGEECGVILEGRLKAYVGDGTYILDEGDCIYLNSSILHRWENTGEIEVRAFWITDLPADLENLMWLIQEKGE